MNDDNDFSGFEAETVISVVTEDAVQATFLFPDGIKAFCRKVNADVICVEDGAIWKWKEGDTDWSQIPPTPEHITPKSLDPITTLRTKKN